MNKRLLITVTAFLVQFSSPCNAATPIDSTPVPASTPTPATITAGETSFTQYCSGCHNFRQDGIGPQLGGITARLPSDWLRNFIKDPQKVIASGDEHARQLVDKYKVVMPAFGLKDDEVDAIMAFMQTQKEVAPAAAIGHGTALSNPIPAPVKFTGLTVNLKQVAQFPTTSAAGKLPLTRITKLDIEPNSHAAFVLDLRGQLYKLDKNFQPSLYLDIAQLAPKFIREPGLATGFGSFAFHPAFAKNGLLYTTHTEAPGSAKADFGYDDAIKVTVQWVLTEWKADDPAAPVFSGKGRELFRVNMVSGIHGVQEIIFNPLSKPGSEDYGMLYIGVGDGGAVENGAPFLPHGLDRVWGTVLRIDPAGTNSANGRYGIPPRNPFVHAVGGKALGEIYAYGFRNPHRITWSKSGDMLVFNIGQTYIESVNLVKPGLDFGWPVREGTFVLDPNGDLNKLYPLPANDSANQFSYPVVQYDHDEGKAISGGYEYRGKAVPLLKGKFVFGDIPTGRLFYVDMKDIRQGKQATIKEWKMSIDGSTDSFAKRFGSDRVDLHFGQDASGELYILTKTDGKMYRLAGAKLVRPNARKTAR